MMQKKLQNWMIDISYEVEAFREDAPEQLVHDRLYEVLQALDVESCEFSIGFVSDQTIQELNKNYRGKDESTDILSFVQSDDIEDFSWPEIEFEDEDISPEARKVLGDIVISLDTLKRNAQSFTVSPDEELFRLLIHGVLHLLGGDHASNDVSEPMLMQQEELLSKLGGSKR